MEENAVIEYDSLQCFLLFIKQSSSLAQQARKTAVHVIASAFLAAEPIFH